MPNLSLDTTALRGSTRYVSGSQFGDYYDSKLLLPNDSSMLDAMEVNQRVLQWFEREIFKRLSLQTS